MLRIEKDSGECVTKLWLSGRVQSDQIAGIQSEMDDDCINKVLDLSEVTLVDLGVVRFLIGCEDEGIELVQCLCARMDSSRTRRGRAAGVFESHLTRFISGRTN